MKIPALSDLELAYETGVHIGDGCLDVFGKHHYKYVISGDAKTEMNYFHGVIAPLIEKLYGLKPKVKIYGSTCYAYVYSKELIEFKARIIGLPIGSKDRLTSLPVSIVRCGRNSVAHLLAGLFDTDGMVKREKRTNGVIYPRLRLALKNGSIVKQVKSLLANEFEIPSALYRDDYYDPRVDKTETRWFLQISGFKNIQLFMRQISLRNQKHLARLNQLMNMRLSNP